MVENYYTVVAKEVLKGKPKENEAMEILTRIAKQVEPLMKKYKWRVEMLSEFFPKNGGLLGMNCNRGEKILIRLRPSENADYFYPLEHILGTMLHELVHNEIGPHSAAFYEKLEQLQTECEEMMDKGFNALTSAHIPWGKGEGQLLGGERNLRRKTPQEVRDAMAKAAEKRKKFAEISGGGGKRLGGSGSVGEGGLAERIREAAEQRQLDSLRCRTAAEQTQIGPGSEGKDVWSCAICTFRNPGPAKRCGMCDSDSKDQITEVVPPSARDGDDSNERKLDSRENGDKGGGGSSSNGSSSAAAPSSDGNLKKKTTKQSGNSAAAAAAGSSSSHSSKPKQQGSSAITTPITKKDKERLNRGGGAAAGFKKSEKANGWYCEGLGVGCGKKNCMTDTRCTRCFQQAPKKVRNQQKWTCGRCTIENNPGTIEQCECCGAARDATPASTAASATAVGAAGGGRREGGASGKQWTCSRCSLINSCHTTECEACGGIKGPLSSSFRPSDSLGLPLASSAAASNRSSSSREAPPTIDLTGDDDL